MIRTYTSLITIAALASLAGCAADTSSSSEDTGTTEQASTTGGVSASVSASNSGSNYAATLTITNNSNGPASNWQVAVNLEGATFNNSTGCEALASGTSGVLIFTPNPNWTGNLNAGASTSCTFNASHSGSYVAPTIVSVDGEANGTAGVSADGVDHIARSVASGALGVAFQYENNKLANDGDSTYALYDGVIWAAQSYVVSNGTIVFDTNAPGYKFIPNQAKAALATMQLDASVASYLVAGLESCFVDTQGGDIFYFQTATLKGFPTTKSGTVTGSPAFGGTPGVDTYTISETAQKGGTDIITITEKSNDDNSFAIITDAWMSTFKNTNSTPIYAKFNVSGDHVVCSPFNGPGGGRGNPYLVVSLNGSTIPARMASPGAQCQNGCTSVIQLDPLAYTIPGAQYDTNNNILGPQINPFTLDPTSLYADPSHYTQFGTNPNSQTGTFSKPVTQYGVSFDKWLACGVSGSGC